MVNISVNKLEKEVKQVLDANPRDTVEVRDLLESQYMQLKARLENNYDIRGIICILRLSGTDETYSIHIMRKYYIDFLLILWEILSKSTMIFNSL